MCAGHDEDGVILLILSKGMSDINEAIGRAYKSRRNPYRDSTGATSESTTESTNTPIYQGPPTNFNTRKRNRNARINAQLEKLKQKQASRKAKQLKQMYNNLHIARLQSLHQTRKVPKSTPATLFNRLFGKRASRKTRRRGKNLTRRPWG